MNCLRKKSYVEVNRYGLFINGKSIDAVDGGIIDVINPATGKKITEVADARAADVDRAVSAAHKAYIEGPWPRMSANERGRVLRRAADLMAERKEFLARIECEDVGKPLAQARNDIDFSIEIIEYCSGITDKILGSIVPARAGYHTLVYRVPIGVIGIITPWNFPLLIACMKFVPAIACGNTVVLKPAKDTPRSVLEVAKIFQEAGLPEGVFNVITGYGKIAGEALVKDGRICRVSFTGETETGKIIMRICADNLTAVNFELGGKTPNVIFSDADLDEALKMANMGFVANAGQICCAGTRLLVEEKIHDEVMERLITHTKAIKLGDPLLEATDMGPLVNVTQQEHVLSYIERGKQEGAVLAYSGSSPEDPLLANGYYVPPVIFDRVDNKMTIAQEEIFGPVLSVITFKDEDEMIRIANDSLYGLAAAIWTRDIRRAFRFIENVEAGTIWVNTFFASSCAVPWGGFKDTGFGREHGWEAAMELFTTTKSVWIKTEAATPGEKPKCL